MNNLQLRPSERKKAKIKIGLQGPSGSGKTYSALLMAFGLVKDWSKIAVIDTENHSADLYAHLGNYKVLDLRAPYSPERYRKAIEVCESAGMEAIIIDSISHEWEGTGGILEVHGNMTGNSFTNWSKITPRHNAFIQSLLQSPCHIIATIRSKQDYVLSDKNGKMVPEKVGLKGVTREGMDYEFTLVLDLDIKHHATASKDRTMLFMDKPPFMISKDTGEEVRRWCEEGTDVMPINSIDETIESIKSCETLSELNELYRYNEGDAVLLPYFKARKAAILTPKNQLNGQHER